MSVLSPACRILFCTHRRVPAAHECPPAQAWELSCAARGLQAVLEAAQRYVEGARMPGVTLTFQRLSFFAVPYDMPRDMPANKAAAKVRLHLHACPAIALPVHLRCCQCSSSKRKLSTRREPGTSAWGQEGVVPPCAGMTQCNASMKVNRSAGCCTW